MTGRLYCSSVSGFLKLDTGFRIFFVEKDCSFSIFLLCGSFFSSLLLISKLSDNSFDIPRDPTKEVVFKFDLKSLLGYFYLFFQTTSSVSFLLVPVEVHGDISNI